MQKPSDSWSAADKYERFMGRWSREVSRLFVDWLAIPAGAHWLEVGCGTGALTGEIVTAARPGSVTACDPSKDFIAFARRAVTDAAVTFATAGADELPRRDRGFDAIVSGLVLNFLPNPLHMVASMASRLAHRGILAAYVWDYSEGMQFLRSFWDAVVSLDPAAASLDEADRFPLCRPEALLALFQNAALRSVEVRPFEIATVFPDFDAYWEPFLGGTGPGPSYVASLSAEARTALRQRLQEQLAPSAHAPIALTARAWGVRGYRAERAA